MVAVANDIPISRMYLNHLLDREDPTGKEAIWRNLQRICFSRVGKWHWPLTRRIDYSEEILQAKISLKYSVNRREIKHTIPKATHPILAVVFSIQNENPVNRRKRAMNGKVVSKRLRRPKVSIVYTAGMANKKLMMPNPMLARRAAMWENPESTKITEE